MKKILVVAFYVLLCGQTLAQSGSVKTKCCGSNSAARVVPCAQPEPPCTAMNCYVGDGLTTQHVDTNGCTVDVLWLQRRDSDLSSLGLFRTRDMAVGQSMQAAPGSASFFPDGILDFDPTGFTVGQDYETNDINVTYCFYGWKAADGFMEYGTFTGDNAGNREITENFSPEVFLIVGRHFLDLGMRWRTKDIAGDFTFRMDGVNLAQPDPDEIIALKDTALGDTFSGALLGIGSNRAGGQYFWAAWNAQSVGDWIFTGKFNGAGVDGDGTQHQVMTPCNNDTKFVMTAADPPAVILNTRFVAHYFRHDLVKPDTYNFAQRMNATNVEDEPIAGVDGGFRELNSSNFILGNATVAGISHSANLLNYTYYYWGLCE